MESHVKSECLRRQEEMVSEQSSVQGRAQGLKYTFGNKQCLDGI